MQQVGARDVSRARKLLEEAPGMHLSIERTLADQVPKQQVPCQLVQERRPPALFQPTQRPQQAVVPAKRRLVLLRGVRPVLTVVVLVKLLVLLRTVRPVVRVAQLEKELWDLKLRVLEKRLRAPLRAQSARVQEVARQMTKRRDPSEPGLPRMRAKKLQVPPSRVEFTPPAAWPRAPRQRRALKKVQEELYPPRCRRLPSSPQQLHSVFLEAKVLAQVAEKTGKMDPRVVQAHPGVAMLRMAVARGTPST